jgi:hypothetical protein
MIFVDAGYLAASMNPRDGVTKTPRSRIEAALSTKSKHHDDTAGARSGDEADDFVARRAALQGRLFRVPRIGLNGDRGDVE